MSTTGRIEPPARSTRRGSLPPVRTHLIVIAAAAALLGAAAGCSSTPVESAPAKHVAFVINGCTMSVTVDTKTKPVVSKSSTPACKAAPPRTLTATVVPGHGPAATTGDGVAVRYIGVDWDNVGRQFDTNWGKDPLTVSPLGSSQVIAGWNLALLGVHVGDRIVMAIPAADGYGTAGKPPIIRPNESLLFVADILKITPASATPTSTG